MDIINILLFLCKKLFSELYNNNVSNVSIVSGTAPITTNFSEMLEETGKMNESSSKDFWLSSGGKVFFGNNLIKTIQGNLPENDKWRLKYKLSNPKETDNGFHPQNIFRLVTKKTYLEPKQSLYFKINKYILSKDIHRSESNGILFFNHYIDQDNLYYAGVRVDGYAVIKKKIKGTYFTMTYKRIFDGLNYSRDKNPNVLPIGKWIGIKTEVENINSNSVLIKLYLDKENNGDWQLVAEAVDNGQSYGGKSILHSGYAGIRSDFMDVEFKDYYVK